MEWRKQWKYVILIENGIFVFSVEALQFSKFRENETKDDKCSFKINGKISSKFCKLTFSRVSNQLLPIFLKYMRNNKTWLGKIFCYGSDILLISVCYSHQISQFRLFSPMYYLYKWTFLFILRKLGEGFYGFKGTNVSSF